MKYAECPTVSVSVTVSAPLSTLWSIVSDIALPTRFSTEITAVEWAGGATAPALGARFVGHSQHDAIGGWQTTCEITGFDAKRLFEWTVLGASGEPSSIWRFTLAPRDDGTVEVEQWFQMGPARSGLNLAIDQMPDKEERIVARRLSEHRANIERTLNGIKELAEGGSR